MPSHFVWYELMTTDLAAAEAFYGSVVGWKASDAGLPDRRYTLMSVGETRIAGLMELPAEARAAGAVPGWLGYVGVADLGAAVKRLEQAGGRVHRPPAEIGVGRFAIVADPQGASFVMFEPNAAMERPPALPPGTPGTAGWHELYARDWEADFAFYAGMFGWTKDQAIDMGPMGTYQLFAAGGDAVGGMMNLPGEGRPSWQYYFTVADVEGAAKRLTGEGGEVLMGPHPVPGGSVIVQCRDPQGAAFALVQPPG